MPGRHRTAVARRRRATESSEYVAMLMRIIYGYGFRVGQDPAALAHFRDLEAGMRDAVNVGIYAANKLEDRPYSINEIASIMGISKQAVHKRVQEGEQVFLRLEAAKASGAVVRLADMRAARAAVLGQAGVADRTGSPRELTAGTAGNE
jgi:hypothetical protein